MTQQNIPIYQPSPEEAAYLANMEDGTADWARKTARMHQHYLRKCENEEDEIRYLVAALELAQARGKTIATNELSRRLFGHGELASKEGKDG